MPINIPLFQDIYNRIKSSLFVGANIEAEKTPVIGEILKFIANDSIDIRKTQQASINELIPQLATEEAYILNNAWLYTNNIIQQKTGTFAIGSLIITAIQQVDIPSGTEFFTGNGQVYKSRITKSCITQTFNIESIERINNQAIVTLPNHGLANKMTLLISGAITTGFNGSFAITLINENQFSYISIGVNVVATGSIIASYLGAKIDIVSNIATSDANADASSTIDLVSAINDVENVYINVYGLTGGSNKEILSSLKQRTIDFLSVPQNKGNKYQQQAWFLQNTNANYAFVFPITTTTEINLYCVLSKLNASTLTFTNFTTPELSLINAQFIDDNQLPLGAINVITTNPSFVNINISISGLSPNTISMKKQIDLRLKEYINTLPVKYYLNEFLNELSVSTIQSVISNTRDEQGQNPKITSLSVTPVTALTNNIHKPILGTISYS